MPQKNNSGKGKNESSKKSRQPQSGSKPHERSRNSQFARVEQPRVDVRLLVDKDWEKKSRVDVPLTGRPMPRNPLLNLKPHTPKDQSGNNSKPEQQGEDNG